MGTYQKMKQAEKVIHALENDLEHDLSMSKHIEKATLNRLNSTRNKYRSLKYQYNVQTVALIVTVIVILFAILASIGNSHICS